MINITSWAELNNIRNDLDNDYQLMNNLSSTDEGYADVGDDWTPIGTGDFPFTGSFNGNGHTISDLIIDASSDNNVGFFGYVNSTHSISKVGLINAIVVGQNIVGGLVGLLGGTCVVSNCYITGQVTGQGGVGGLVGTLNPLALIVNCYSIATVYGNTEAIGGLIGIYNGIVANSYCAGQTGGGGSATILGGFIGLSNTGIIPLNCGWYRDVESGVDVAIGYNGEEGEVELITYNIKVGGGEGYIDDSADWFYDKTRDIYDTTSTGYDIWDFTTPIWVERINNYPNLKVEETPPTEQKGMLPIFKRS